MTRINSGIPVKSLTDEHLLAEHREIKRLPYYIRRIVNGEIKMPQIPETICLGSGHVKFFVNKGKFTYNRYTQIYQECKLRNYAVTDFSSNWLNMPNEFYEDYQPNEYDRILLTNRLLERIKNTRLKSFHYYGRQITKEEAINLLYKL